MLVLQREVHERIRIGDDIVVTIVGIRDGYKVRVGVDAPATVAIHREEVWDAIRRENAAARKAEGTVTP